MDSTDANLCPGAAHMKAMLFAALASLLSIAAPAKTVFATPETPDSPTLVEVGIWLNGIHTIDFIDGSFGAEFYLWWISPDPDFRPFEVFQVLNGRNWTTRAVNRRVLPDGNYHTSGNVSVILNHDWELYYYPFDLQELKIIIETPYTASELRMVPNKKESVVSRFVDVKGYQVSGLDLDEHVEKYDTSFGFRGNVGKRFSRLVVEVDLKRESGRLVIAILLGFIVANIIALFTYAIDVSMLGIRASMVTSAIFSAVGNMHLLNSSVNPAVGSLLVDRFALGTFTAILVALLNGIIVERLVIRKKDDPARLVNKSVFVLVAVGSVIYYTLAFKAAIR